MAKPRTISKARLKNLLAEVKRIGQKYYALTGRPLGITGEVAEYEAMRLLGLEPAPVRQAGYDATRRVGRRVVKLQIKGRCVRDPRRSQRLGVIKLTHDWDAVLLVLMDASFETVAIYEADRPAVEKVLRAMTSNARQRGLAVSAFKRIADPVWPAS